MTDNVTLNAGKPWTLTAVEKLQELWKDGVQPALIGQAIGRPEDEVRAKAAELKLPQHVESPG
ncbi:MAG: hypothetical protein KDJ88_18365 [Bauldia sp.]|nr:hypothetical protein [Bauldia sp.]